MKKLTLLSLLAVVIVIVSVFFLASNKNEREKQISLPRLVQYDTLSGIIREMKDSLIGFSAADSTAAFYNGQLDTMQLQVTSLKTETVKYETAGAKDLSLQTFWIKVIFSGIFCLAALFVVLSKKYDEPTKKWAFSVLTLIAGVWIGTVT